MSARDWPSREADAPTLVQERGEVVEERVGPPPHPPRRRGPLLWPWLLLLLVLVIGGLVAAWLLTRHTNGASTVNVPNVVRLKQDEAVRRLHGRGLLTRIHPRPASPEPAGTVVAQRPGPGANVLRHSVVTLGVSGRQPVLVPGVVGLRLPAAVKLLQAEGFGVDTVRVASTRPSGTVLGQTPVAQSHAAAGSTVTLRIPRSVVSVPGVVGEPRAEALASVRDAGLVPEAFVVSSSRPKGTVVAQNPAAGRRAATGSHVRLNVSNGASSAPAPPPPPPSKPSTVTVPDVTGQLQDAAQQKLNVAGLKAGVVYVHSQERQGTVVSESPASGSKQQRGTRIQLNASLGPRPGALRGVPAVRGMDTASARSRLVVAGFRVQVLPQGVQDRSQIGKVVDEQPAGGRRVPAGSRVTIYAGHAA